MIQTKKDLHDYLSADKDAFSCGRDSLWKEKLIKSDKPLTERYVKYLRYTEFYRNNRDKNLLYKVLYIYYRYKGSRLGKKLNIAISTNSCGPGLRIWHPSGIMISWDAKIGKYFTVRKDALVGNSIYDQKAPIIGDYVHFGVGAQAVGAVVIGRGAIIGNNAVVVRKVPPYALVVGNPGKVIGFRMTPEEIVQFELARYPEADRIPIDELKDNYKKYYISKRKEIRSYIGNL